MNSLSTLDIKTLKEHNIEITEELIQKITDGYPIQYIVGDVEFLDYKILVNELVLIPRFETELLVEKIVNKTKLNDIHIADICAGSGCIGIALSKKLHSSCDYYDVSIDANQVCNKNISNYNLFGNVITKDILVDSIPDEYEVIVSNPPYLNESDKVDPNTRYEPQIALFAYGDDIIFYKRILEMVKDYKRWQLIAFEIGENQSDRIINYGKQLGYNHIYTEQDYNGIKRYIFIER